jgi:hypothetical protein
MPTALPLQRSAARTSPTMPEHYQTTVTPSRTIFLLFIFST